jgi:hypothetical protein
MKRFVLAIAAFAFIALPGTARAAQHDHPAVTKTSLRFSESIVIGGVTVKAGEYRFICQQIDGVETMVVKSTDTGKEVARVVCKPTDLAAPAKETLYETVKDATGAIVLRDLQIKGQTIAHVLL